MLASPGARLRLAGIIAGVLFIAGYAIVAVIPGGGETNAADFAKYYGPDGGGRRGTSLILLIALVASCHLMVWFFAELRTRIGDGALTRYSYTMTVVGAVLVTAGGGILFGPTGVKINDASAAYIGDNVAVAIAQAGLFVMLVGGMYAFATGVFFFGLAARRAAALPSWLAIGGMVVGVLLIGSYIWVPGLLLPLWVIVTAIAAGSSPSEPLAA